MKKLFNLAAFGFIAKVILVIFFAFAFEQLSFGQSCTNLVVNGDFSSGNTGFTNNYTYFAPGGATAIGKYSVVNSTHVPTANPQWACTGHTTASATDQFLMCDGASQAGNIAWKQTVSGNGQGCYKFCFWVNNLVIPTKDYADPIIQAKINGANVGTAVIVPENPDTWVQVCVTWNGALPANLEILSTQPAGIGNDFAIDDISFSKCCDVSLNLQAAAGCSLNYNVSATACGAGPFTYQWCNGSTGSNYNTSVPCGNNTFCVTMTDSQQCTATATQTINAKDNVPPVALCKPGIGVLLNANCQYVVDAAFVNNGSTDNCGIQSVTVSPTLLTGCGNTTVTLTVKDLCNNTSTCTMGIQTIETTPPTITCPANKTINCDDSILPANTGSPTSQDACGIKSTTYVNGISEKLICGSRFVRTWTVEDNCGNKSTCTQVITITDTKPPVIICPPNKTLTCGTENVLSITGIATATDNCTATADISITSSDFVTGIADCDQTIIRTWTAKDRCGNTASCIQTINIIDNVKPALFNCPPNTTVNGTIGANGLCTAFVPLIKPTATDNCDPSVTITHNIPIGNIFSSGNTTVIWTATDNCNNTTTCSTIVTVKCESCECGTFSNILYRPTQGGTSQPKNCGDTLVAPCKPAFNPIITGTFACIGNCPNAPITWQLTSPSGVVTTGTVPNAATFSVSILGASLSTTGVYQLTLTGQCGNKVCPPCKFFIKVTCDDCKCGTFGPISYINSPVIPTIVKNCGDTLAVACKPINSLAFNGTFNCIGTCPAAPINWQLLNPTGGVVVSGTTAGPSFSVAFTGALLSTSGVYQLVFTGQCGNTICPPCKIYIKVNCTNCECGEFTNLQYIPSPVTPPIPKKCGDTLSIACKPTINPMFSGTFNCVGSCPTVNPIKWELFNASGASLATGTASSTFSVSVSGALFSTSGVYQLVLTGQCGNTVCPPCKLYIKVNCGTCECGTVNNAVVYHVANTPVAIACNNTTRVKIPCRKVGPNFFIHGDFPCLGGNCGQNNVQWELTRPSGTPVTGTTAIVGINHFDLTLPWTHFAAAGNYSLKVTRFCGDKPCVCVFNFVVEACPCTCDALKSEVYQGFNVSSIIAGCKRKFKPIALCPSDAVVWNISRLTGGTWTTTLSSTGANALIVTFPGTGWYNVCMIVSRIDPMTGKQCKWEYCKKIYVKCFVFGDIITDSYNSSCIDNVVLNGNFTDTTNVTGELGSGGSLKHWAIFKNQGSDGTVMVEDSTGAFDAGSATIIGRKNNYAGIVQKVNLSKNKLAHVVFEYYNWQNGNTPAGTTIDILLVPNATNDLGGQLLHRINVTNDTSSAWKQVSFTVGGNVNFDNKHFVCCVQNAETDKVFSVISVDNFELCSLEKTASKEETPERVEFKVFPNPNTGDFNIELPFDATEKMKLRVTDLTGRVLTEKQPTIGSASQYMELSNLANGLYFIQVVQEGRVIGVERFVKQ